MEAPIVAVGGGRTERERFMSGLGAHRRSRARTDLTSRARIVPGDASDLGASPVPIPVHQVQRRTGARSELRRGSIEQPQETRGALPRAAYKELPSQY